MRAVETKERFFARSWRSSPRTLLRYLISLDDTSHHIALGAAVGIFVGLTPTPGIQMLLVVLLSRICRRMFYFNLPAALVATYASNPITALPLAWLSYRVGRLFVGGDLEQSELEELIRSNSLTELRDLLSALFFELGWAYLIGSLILAAASALATYGLMLAIVRLCRD